MKKFKIFSLFITLTICFSFSLKVNALDYILESKWSGYTPGTTFWIDSGYRDVGAYNYKRPTNTGVGDYIDVSYCSSGTVKTYTLDRPDLQRDPIYLDTGEWCTTGQYSGTIKHNYYMVGEWTYTENSGYAYLEGSTGSYFHNTSNYSVHVLFYGIANISELDMSLSILAYLKSQKDNTDYSDTLNKIQQNTSEYNQEIGIVQDKLDETNTSINDMRDAITSIDTNESQTQANSFFEGFESDNYGLSDIVTMPLELIRGLTSNSCVSLSLTLPFVNKTFELPCMSSIYQKYFGSFFDLYQTVTFGFISYWVIVRIFNLVKDFKNPDHDEIEVLDL